MAVFNWYTLPSGQTYLKLNVNLVLDITNGEKLQNMYDISHVCIFLLKPEDPI